MKDMKLGVLLPIFLFFMLFAGIIIIYREEIEKMELFGKLHVTPVPATFTDRPAVSPPPSIPAAPGIGATVISPASGSSTSDIRSARLLSFGNGRIVDATLRNIPIVNLRGGEGSLHTLLPDVADYYAQAFVEEASGLYSPSPHAGSVVFLDRASGVKASEPDREYFVLLVSNVLPSPITITDWKVFDRETKRIHRIPRAVKVFGSGDVSAPVVASAGDRIFVSSGDSPVKTSFQVNKCSGYRSQSVTFVPSVKTACSDPVREFTSHGKVPFSDDICYDTVSSLARCTTVKTVPQGVTIACRDFLQQVLSEKGCVSRHRNDSDFFTGEWRLFLKSDRELWKNRDNVLYLLDENDLLVATMVYR